MSDDKFKICRWCHKIYNTPFCGNGCEREKIFEIKDDIEPREIVLNPNKNNNIFWLCLSCREEYDGESFKKLKNICSNCSKENDFYPFTKKACSNCSEDGKNRELPIWAKACEKCGKKDFIINSNKKVSQLHSNFDDNTPSDNNQKEDLWEGPPPIFELSQKIKEERESKNLISLTFTILNTNYEEVLFAEEKSLTLFEIMKNSKGYIPRELYEELLSQDGKYNEIFHIFFEEENEEFSINCAYDYQIQELDTTYNPTSETKVFNSLEKCKLYENKLTRMIVPFKKSKFHLKIIIWVY